MYSLNDIFAGAGSPTKPISDDDAFELLKNIGRELQARHVWNQNVYEGNESVFLPERERWVEYANNALLYILDNFSSEQCIAGYKVLMQDFLLPFEPNSMTAFDRFSERLCGEVLKTDGFGPLGDAWSEAVDQPEPK